MRFNRRNLMVAGAALATPFVITGARAEEPAVSHSSSTISCRRYPTATRKMLAPWAEKVGRTWQGKIKIDIFPSMQLGGTPPQLYDQARDGVVDIVLDAAGLDAGPLSDHGSVRTAVHRAEKRGIVNAQGGTGIRRHPPQGRGQGR